MAIHTIFKGIVNEPRTQVTMPFLYSKIGGNDIEWRKLIL